MKKIVLISLCGLLSTPVYAENVCNVKTIFDKTLHQANTLARTTAKRQLEYLISHSEFKQYNEYTNVIKATVALVEANKKANQFNEFCYTIKITELDILVKQV
jgi:hypothetical protein